MSLAVGITIVTLLAAGLGVQFKVSIANTFATSLLFCIAQLYLFGFFGIMQIGYFLISATAIVVLIYFLRQAVFKKNPVFFKTLFCTPMLAMTALLIYSLLINSGSYIEEWDACVFWYINFRETLTTNTLHIFSPGGLHYINHPPLLPILQYFFNFGGTGRDFSLLYTATNILPIALCLPIFGQSDIKKRRIEILKTPVKFILLIVFLNIYNAESIAPFRTLMSDIYLSLLFGYALYCLFNFKLPTGLYIMNLSLALFAITLVRVNGIVFAVVVLTIPAYQALSKIGVRGVVKILPYTAVVAVTYLSWILPSSVLGIITAQSSLPIFTAIKRLLSGNRFEVEVVKTVILNITTGNFGIGTNFGILTFATVMILLWLIIRKKYFAINTTVILIVGFFVYVFFVLCSYLVSFSAFETYDLPSFYRYISVYIFGVLFFEFLYFSRRCTTRKIVIITAILLLSLPQTGRIFQKTNTSPVIKELAVVIDEIDLSQNTLLIVDAPLSTQNNYVKLSPFLYPYIGKQVDIVPDIGKQYFGDTPLSEYADVYGRYDYTYYISPQDETLPQHTLIKE